MLTQLRDELYKTYSKYMGYRLARGTSLIPREKQLEIQHQLAQLSQLIGKIDTLIRSSRESEHNMYKQELIASEREYKQASAAAPLGVDVVPATVQPSLIQSDINFYSKEIALTIATAPLGGIVFRVAGKGLKALKALRAARAAKVAKAATGKVLATSKAVGGWKSRPPGIQVRKIGGYWVKRVDPKASKFMQAWAKETIRAQEAALLKLQKAGSPAAKFKRLKDGSLAIEDVGPVVDRSSRFDPNYWKALFRDSKIIGVVNDLKPGNYGAGYRAFDPAADRYTLAAGAIGGAIVAGGVLYLLDKNGIVHIIGDH